MDKSLNLRQNWTNFKFSVCRWDNLLRMEAVLLDYITWWDEYVIWCLWLFIVKIYWPIFSSKFHKDRDNKKKKHVGMWFLSGNFSEERTDVENIGPDLIIRPSTAMFYFMGWAFILSILCLSVCHDYLLHSVVFLYGGGTLGMWSVFCPARKCILPFWLLAWSRWDDLLYPSYGCIICGYSWLFSGWLEKRKG